MSGVQSDMRERSKGLLGLVLLAVVGLVVANLKSTATHGLRAEVVTTNSDIGIPGITKMYATKVTNRSLLPVRIASCSFVDDTLSPGTMVAYGVQRWNDSKKQWDTIAEFGKSACCKPYPLGIVKATLTRRWLWPGQSLSTGEEATAARDGFGIGDHARFVIFVGDAGDYSSSVVSSEFRIDEHAQTNLNLRVRH